MSTALITRPTGTPPFTPDGVSVIDLWFILRRQLRFILLTVVLGTSLAILLGLAQPPTYTSTALIVVEPRDNQIIGVDSTTRSQPIDAAMLETHTKLLRSRELAVAVIRKLHLTDDPAFKPGVPLSQRVDHTLQQASTWLAAAMQRVAPTLASLEANLSEAAGLDGGVLAAGRDGASTRPAASTDGATPTGWDRLEPAPPVANGSIQQLVASSDPGATGPASDGASLGDDGPLMQAAVIAFERRLDPAVSGKSYIINVSFTDGSPTRAALIANTTAQQYIRMLREQTRSSAAEASGAFADRLSELRAEAQRTQAAVENFKADHNIVTSGGVEVSDQQLTQLTEQLIKLQADEQEKAARLGRVVELSKHGGSSAAVAAVVDSQLLNSLREQLVALSRREADMRGQYGDRHPRMIAVQAQQRELESKFAGEVQRTILDLRYQVDVARRQEASLRKEIDQVTTTKGGIAKVSSQLSLLQQQANAARRIYETLLRQTEETKQQAILGEPNSRIASRAAPPNGPDRLSLKLFGFIGFVGSAFGASLIAIFRDRTRGIIHRGRELSDHVDLPCLGLVPRVATRQLPMGSPVVAADTSKSAFTEALRSIALALLRECVEHPQRTLAMTSSLPKEGKSFLAASLAITFGRLGYRTLLVDLDLRRPRVGRLFDIVGAGGIVEVMSGALPADECIIRNVAEHVDILPARALPSDPVVVLASPLLSKALERLGRDYDWIILDGPPALGLSDACLLGRLAHMVLLVTRWGSTPLSALKVSAEHVRNFGVNLVGGVLNDVDLKRHQAYGYGVEDHEGYYSRYKSYYVDT